MNASTLIPSAALRAMAVATEVLRHFLMVAGLVFITGALAKYTGGFELPSLTSPAAAAEESTDAAADDIAAAESLSPRLRGALDYVARRYRVSTEALQPVFATAQSVGRELHLDPLLIIAVIGVESSFNPFSQSVVGAQGLMQVVPRFHQDKLPEEAASFLDPVTNVQVGARVLKEAIRRYGGLEEGLQQFAGAANDGDRRYASRVLAERQRLEQAAQRLRAS